jgi:branched-chain amino acid transport system substrate-binding protein
MLAGVMLMFAVNANAQEPIRIEVLLPFTGPLAKNGIELAGHADSARHDQRARRDQRAQDQFVQGDATTPNAAISETERLITKEGIKITTGSFASPLAIAVSQGGASRRVSLGDDRRGRSHHPPWFQAYVPGRRARPQI